MSRYDIEIQNLAARMQAYSEGVKAWMYSRVQDDLDRLEVDLTRVLSRTEYRELNKISKTALNRLVAELNGVQARVFGTIAARIVDDIEAFENATISVSQRQLAHILIDHEDAPPDYTVEDVEDDEGAAVFLALFGASRGAKGIFSQGVYEDREKLVRRIKAELIPATGNSIDELILSMGRGSIAEVDRLVRRAWAGGLDGDQTLDLLSRGAKPGVMSGIGNVTIMRRIANQVEVAIDTAAQQANVLGLASASSTMTDRYKWNSVMDSRTTEICRSRNGNIYSFPDGPLPPAHMRCRSTISPIIDDSGEELSFEDWLDRNPDLKPWFEADKIVPELLTPEEFMDKF